MRLNGNIISIGIPYGNSYFNLMSINLGISVLITFIQKFCFIDKAKLFCLFIVLLVFPIFSFSQIEFLNSKRNNLSFQEIDCSNLSINYEDVINNNDLSSKKSNPQLKKGISGFPFSNQLSQNQNGWISIQVNASRRKAFGLAESGNNQSYNSINYGFLLKNYSKTAVIIEKGKRIKEIEINIGDRLSISKMNGRIIYELEERNIRTVRIKKNQDLEAKVWLLNHQSYFQNVSMSFCENENLVSDSCNGTAIAYQGLINAKTERNSIQGSNENRGRFHTTNKLNRGEDGWLCLTINNSRRKAIGFSYEDSGEKKSNINFGFQFKNYTSTAQIIENGKVIKSLKIRPEDQFKLERNGIFIHYFHNGQLIRKVKTDSQKIIIVRGWLINKDAFFDNVFVNFDQFDSDLDDETIVCDGFDVNYTDLVNASVLGNTIQFQSGNSIYGGFASINTIPPFQDGYMCFKVIDLTHVKAIGLSFENENHLSSTIDFSFYFKGFMLKENGVTIGSFTPEVGDILKIERSGSHINYYENNILLHSTLLDLDDIGKALILDGFLTSNESFTDVRMSVGVNEDCTLQLLPGTNIVKCFSDDIQLFASGASYFKWLPTTGLSCPYCPNPILSETYGTIAGSYTLHGFQTIDDFESDIACSQVEFSVIISEGCEEDIIGCCFSNYGATVTVTPGAYINIHCNLLNEVGMTNGVLQKGEFENDGFIRVEKDWINNGYNHLFLSQNGISELFGGYQKMRGNSSTHYNDLLLTGSGKKEVFIDEFSYGILDLTNIELVLGNFTFFVENNFVGAIQQTTGFISTDGTGYLSRQIIPSGSYNYPLGSTIGSFRIRPIDLFDAAFTGQYKIRFINNGPFSHGLIDTAPNILSINNLYYHRIDAPSENITIGIRSYFNQQLDGNFQALAHWETVSNGGMPPFHWESTPIATLPNTLPPGLFFLDSYGQHDFDGEPFVLAQSGFYVNTDDFGNGNTGSSGTGTIITINPVSGNQGGSLPNGGGLGQTNGTGGNTTIAPFPLPGDYGIDITTGNQSEPGDITFTVSTDGTIDETTIVYVDETTGESGNLSTDLYSIDPVNNGIILNDTPPDLDFDCLNSIKIKMGVVNPMVLSSTEHILIDGISVADISSLSLVIFDQTNTSTNSISLPVNTTISVNPGTFPPGPYSFELNINLVQGGQETIHGQFIKS